MSSNRLAYLDCASGLSGDMLLAAVVAAGVSPHALQRRLAKALRTFGWRFEVKHVLRHGLPAVHLDVSGDRALPSLAWMRRAISHAALPRPVVVQALAAIDHLASAEQAVHHGSSASGNATIPMACVDTLVDVVGGPLGMFLMGIDRVYASPLNTGTLAPAALAIMQSARLPVYTEAIPYELVTPTGAALAASMVQRFGALPLVTVQGFGCGAGARDLPERPNLLRLIVGRPSGMANGQPVATAQRDEVLLLETQMDDMDPRVYPHVMERLFHAGALDVWLTTVMMKKGRPGLLMSVLAHPQDETALAEILFRETTTLGVRRTLVERWVLPRRAVAARGTQRSRYKEASLGPGDWKRSVEYESARRVAARQRRPLYPLLRLAFQERGGTIHHGTSAKPR